jgi:prepilin-type N-terminal cleavage/methylation domain-containing protein
MNGKRRASGAFTLIEFLCVLLMMGILLAIGIPKYLSMLGSSRAASANHNSRMIANSVQQHFVRDGGVGYAAYTGALLQTDAAVIADLSGTIPKNPCTNGNQLNGTDYTVTPGAATWTIKPSSGVNCDAAEMQTFKLGQ